ncbi:hypothetical protein NKH77_54510 [Streptomyces sp. M19]
MNFPGDSDAYHLWTLIGTADYLRFSGDLEWVRGVWDGYLRGLAHITAKIDRDGLLDVTGAADWARADADGKNLEANAILYRALVTGRRWPGAGRRRYGRRLRRPAAALKSAVASAGYWDEDAGLYRDKPSGPGRRCIRRTATRWPSGSGWWTTRNGPVRSVSRSPGAGRPWGADPGEARRGGPSLPRRHGGPRALRGGPRQHRPGAHPP